MTSEPNIGNFKEPIEQMAEETKDSHEVTCEHNIGEIKKLIKQMAEEPKDSHEENATYEKLKSKIDEFKGSKEALDLQPKGSEDTTEPASETQNKPGKKNATCDKLKCLIDKFKGCKDTTEPATKTQNKQEEALDLQLKRSEDTTDPATETQNKQEQKNATCKKLKSLIDKLKESKDTTKSATKPLNKQEEAALDLLFYMMKTFKFWSKKEMEIVKRLVEKYPDLITKQPLITKQHESQRNGQTPRPQADCTRNTGLTKQPLITKQHESQRNGQTPPSQAACTCKTGLTEQPDSQRNGQTPLHLAVCKGNTGLIELFLSISSVSEQHGEQKSGNQNNEEQKQEQKHNPFLAKVTGDICKETVMMAEIPLSVAALTFRTDTVKVLLDRGAPIDGTNNLGDNVCHSLIRYASLYPEKVNRVRDMFVFLEREIKAKDDKRKDKTKNDESGKDGKAKEKDKKKRKRSHR